LIHDISRFPEWSYPSSLTPRRCRCQFIFFLPAKKVANFGSGTVLICVVEMLLTCYQVLGSGLGRLPAILISSVPPSKFRDNGLPRLGQNKFLCYKISLIFTYQSSFHEDIQTILRHSQRRNTNHTENNKITVRDPKFSQGW
jgi:hypothetical protein